MIFTITLLDPRLVFRLIFLYLLHLQRTSSERDTDRTMYDDNDDNNGRRGGSLLVVQLQADISLHFLWLAIVEVVVLKQQLKDN